MFENFPNKRIYDFAKRTMDCFRKLSFNFWGISFFVFFGTMSIIDSYSRVLITDPAFYLFNIINESDFFIPGTRYTAVISQVLTVLGVKMNLPLKILIPLFSLSYVITRFIYFYLVSFVFKNRPAGLAIIAISVIGVAESYFRPTSESTIAMLNSLFLYVWLGYSNKCLNGGKWNGFLGFLGTVLIILIGFWTHPVAIFTLIFVIAFYIIQTKQYVSIYPYLTLILTVVIFLGNVFGGTSNDHHNELYANLFKSPLIIFEEIKTYYPYKFFINYFKSLFWSTIAFFLLAFTLAIGKKKWLTSLLLITYSLVYFVIACTSFKDGDSNMQMEKIFLPLVFFSALILGESYREYKMNKQLIFSVIMIGIFIAGFSRIQKFRPIYAERIHYIQHEVIEKVNLNENRKLVIRKEQLSHNPMIYSWAFGIETLMLSTINEDIEPLTVFIVDDLETIYAKMELSNNFIPAHFLTSYNQAHFNPNYFKLPEHRYIYWDEEFN